MHVHPLLISIVVLIYVLAKCNNCFCNHSALSSVIIYHRGASLSEQHTNWSLYKARFVSHK